MNDCCAICLDCANQSDSRAEFKKLSCNHEFHKECIDIWFKKQNTCPLCRAKNNYDNYHSEVLHTLSAREISHAYNAYVHNYNVRGMVLDAHATRTAQFKEDIISYGFNFV